MILMCLPMQKTTVGMFFYILHGCRDNLEKLRKTRKKFVLQKTPYLTENHLFFSSQDLSFSIF